MANIFQFSGLNRLLLYWFRYSQHPERIGKMNYFKQNAYLTKNIVTALSIGCPSKVLRPITTFNTPARGPVALCPVLVPTSTFHTPNTLITRASLKPAGTACWDRVSSRVPRWVGTINGMWIRPPWPLSWLRQSTQRPGHNIPEQERWIGGIEGVWTIPVTRKLLWGREAVIIITGIIIFANAPAIRVDFSIDFSIFPHRLALVHENMIKHCTYWENFWSYFFPKTKFIPVKTAQLLSKRTCNIKNLQWMKRSN